MPDNRGPSYDSVKPRMGNATVRQSLSTLSVMHE